MNAITYYTSSTQNEFFKLKRTFAFWLTFLSAFFVPAIFFLIYLFRSDKLIPADGVNPWDSFLGNQIRAVIPFLMPLFVILITSLIIQVEHKSNGLKHLFTLPIPKWSVYFGKLTIVILAILFAFILFFGIMIATGYIVGLIHPELKLAEISPKYMESIQVLFRTFISILGIIGLQFWLSFRIKNFIIPLGIGIILMIAGMILANGEEALYYPYSYNILSLNPENGQWLPEVCLYSLGYFVLFSVAGFLDVKRRNVK